MKISHKQSVLFYGPFTEGPSVKKHFQPSSNENWFKCSGYSDFKFATIERAQNTCREMFSTIQSNFSEVLF